MKIHLISIGGAVMHNMALALQHLGHDVSGSDDEIFEPSRTRLNEAGLLPSQMGWDENRITNDLDLIILGMHARPNNEELLRAQELGLKVMSFPEYIAQESADKVKIVVGGSHGKTTTTAMIMHALRKLNRAFDYLVGSQLDGFDRMVQLSDAPLIIIEGDEYLSSPIDRKPKFLWYDPDVAIVTGIAWDHINVFPSFEMYVDQFKIFVEELRPEAELIYFKGDEHMPGIAASFDGPKSAYAGLDIRNMQGVWGVQWEDNFFPMKIFGDHNFQNMHSAVLALEKIGIAAEESLKALSSFEGTARRLELVHDDNQVTVYRDFAHSPSKVKATVDAVRKGYPEHHLVAVLELHTFSSLNKEFLALYEGSMDQASESFVYFNPHVFEMKKLEAFTVDQVKNAFGDVEATTDSALLFEKLKSSSPRPIVYLMMSSGNFDKKPIPEALL